MTHPENQKHARQFCGRRYGWEESRVGGVKKIVLPLARGGLTPTPFRSDSLLAARFCDNIQPFLWE